MSQKPVSRLRNIHSNVREKLQAAKITTCGSLLEHNENDLMQIDYTLDLFHARHVLNTVYQTVAPSPKTAYEFWQNWQSKVHALSTQLPLVDGVLHGGIPYGSITEICGPSGMGKTQFALSLCVNALVQAESGHVVYIDTERKFSASRVREIAARRFPEIFDEAYCAEAEHNTHNMLGRIHVYFEDNNQSLHERIKTLDTELIERDVRLIVLDSAAALIRAEQNTNGIQTIQKQLIEQASLLKSFAEQFNLPVLVTNQVRAQLSRDGAYGEYESSAYNGDINRLILHGNTGETFVPSLGTAWSHAVNTRLALDSGDASWNEKMRKGFGTQTHIRRLTIAKSPLAPNIEVPYIIQAAGFVAAESYF